MTRLIDLSHTFENDMPGFRMKLNNQVIQYRAQIKPFLTHEQSAPYYSGKAAFEITEMAFHTSIGTYLDSPYHRWPDRRDISELSLDEVILPGVVIDARGMAAWDALSAERVRDLDVRGKAVLVNFGWDQHWGGEAYYQYPFLSREAIRVLADAGAKLVGVDTLNIDDSRDPERPAHSILLGQDTLVVENLTHLDQLHGNIFRFFAVPIKARQTAAMPVRAFAEIA